MSRTTSEESDDRIAGGSPERFGFSWDTYSELLPVHEEQFRLWTTPLQPQDWHGKQFLDAGCGMGRNSFWPLSYGAAACVSIDVNKRTLERARQTLAPFPQAEVRNLSIYDIPEADMFDVAFSIGVVHHLADPDAALAKLKQAVKPGGLVLVWLYGAENNGWIIWVFNPFRRVLFSRLPLGVVHFLSLPLTCILWLALRPRIPGRPYLDLIRGFGFRHLRAIVFDHMIPRIARYYTKAEAIDLFTRAGLTNIQAHWTNEMSWTVTGRKPL